MITHNNCVIIFSSMFVLLSGVSGQLESLGVRQVMWDLRVNSTHNISFLSPNSAHSSHGTPSGYHMAGLDCSICSGEQTNIYHYTARPVRTPERMNSLTNVVIQGFRLQHFLEVHRLIKINVWVWSLYISRTINPKYMLKSIECTLIARSVSVVLVGPGNYWEILTKRISRQFFIFLS